MLPIIEYIKLNVEKFIPLGRALITIVITLIIFEIILKLARKGLLKATKTKKQRSNVKIFSKVLSYFFFIIIILSAIFSYAGSWTGWGVSIGLFSAALGWALQKPITGIAAWIMIVLRRPFEIGDRIIIGNVRGDVVDITLTHVYISEIGGIVAGEENSGRVILVPNSILFEQNIINYTSKNEFILDQVILTITYESDINKALELVKKSARKYIKESIKKTGKTPYVRTYFADNGMKLNVRYFAPAKNLQEISSNISKEIFDNIMKEKKINIAYPHTEVLLNKSKN
jgi:small-conductance mechanosensitive channel